MNTITKTMRGLAAVILFGICAIIVCAICASVAGAAPVVPKAADADLTALQAQARRNAARFATLTRTSYQRIDPAGVTTNLFVREARHSYQERLNAVRTNITEQVRLRFNAEDLAKVQTALAEARQAKIDAITAKVQADRETAVEKRDQYQALYDKTSAVNPLRAVYKVLVDINQGRIDLADAIINAGADTDK